MISLGAAGAIAACGGGAPANHAVGTTRPAARTTVTNAGTAPAGTGAPATSAPSPSATTRGTPTTTTAAAPGTTATTPAPGPSAGLAAVHGKTIVLDPGHNGGNFAAPATINKLVFIGNGSKACDTTGAATNDGRLTEAAYNFDVATRLAAVLRSAGATVVLTRPDNTGVGPCITIRAAIGNDNHADAALSIHADGGPAGGRGFHVIEPAAVVAGGVDNTAIVAPSARLALDVRRDYQAATGEPFSTYAGSSALETRNDLGGLNLSTVPKVFVETANMRNSADAALIESPDFRQKVAQGLAQALADFLAGR